MKNKLANKTKGEIAMDYVERIINLLEGESSESPVSMIITVSGHDDGHQMDIFSFEDPAIVERLADGIKDRTCGKWTEEITLDE